MLYHGTSLVIALQIAESGAILSPYHIKLKQIESIDEFEQNFPGKSKEEMALKFALSSFGNGEEPLRVCSVSMTPIFNLALSYANCYEKFKGGLVLGLDLAQPDYTCQLDSPVSLDSLCEIYLSEKSLKFAKEIKKAFAKYNPRYELI